MNERSTNELFGYPPDARLLIINADDFGMCHSNNEAISRTLTHGIVCSTTLMTPCPWAPHAMEFLSVNPGIAFGVHLTIVNDFSMYRWRPLSSVRDVPSLVDETGYFYSYDRKEEMTAQAVLTEVELEYRAQIDMVMAAGLKPTHLDWHCIADGGRADIFDLTFDLAREYGLAMRVHDRANAEKVLGRSLPVTDYDVLDSYRLTPSEKPERYAQLLRELPAGLTEWAVHPSLGNDESRALEGDAWPIRHADYDFLMSQNARDILTAEGIILLNYRELQNVWSSQGAIQGRRNS